MIAIVIVGALVIILATVVVLVRRELRLEQLEEERNRARVVRILAGRDPGDE